MFIKIEKIQEGLNDYLDNEVRYFEAIKGSLPLSEKDKYMGHIATVRNMKSWIEDNILHPVEEER